MSGFIGFQFLCTKKLEYLMWRICGERRFEVTVKGQKVMPRSVEISGTTHLA
jgi:hypothetical protein